MKSFQKIEHNDTYTTTKYVNKQGLLHREDGPALIEEYLDGTKSEEWWYDYTRHRYGGPAITYFDGSCEFWVNGLFVSPEVNEWLSERDYEWGTMNEQEKWELDLFMRTLS